MSRQFLILSLKKLEFFIILKNFTFLVFDLSPNFVRTMFQKEQDENIISAISMSGLTVYGFPIDCGEKIQNWPNLCPSLKIELFGHGKFKNWKHNSKKNPYIIYHILLGQQRVWWRRVEDSLLILSSSQHCFNQSQVLNQPVWQVVVVNFWP